MQLLSILLSLVLVAPPNLYLSTDHGATWTDFTHGLPADTQPRNLAEANGTLYLGTHFHGVFYLADDGCGWEPLGEGLPLGEAFFPTALTVRDSALVVANYWNGTHRSTDGGAHWQPATTDLSGVVLDLLYLGDTLLAGTRDGLFQSLDHGDNWTPRGSDRTGINALARHDGRLVVAQQNGLGVMTGDTISWSDTRSETAILQLFSAGAYVYAVSHGGEVFRSRTGEVWEIPPSDPVAGAPTNLAEALWRRAELPGLVTETSRGWVMALGVGCE